jgi:oxygen-independent coproporphyrinogen-3 oxidase
MRCGYCNLFTRARPASEEVAAYLAALEREARRMRVALEGTHFARLALGGGTPTFLGPSGLERVFALAEQLGASPSALPASVEVSPGTATSETLQVLSAHRVQRVSIGVESFQTSELRALGRPERPERAEAALERIRHIGFPVLNVDLIYGMEGQTPASFLQSLETALTYHPEELFLYPLYVRPLTGLGRRDASAPATETLTLLHNTARAFLKAHGYVQHSLRMFRRRDVPPTTGPHYCCQDDGMVGLGCGARSYTRSVHYSSRFAVGASAIRQLLTEYMSKSEADFGWVDWGVRLDSDEQRRRYAVKSILRIEGLDTLAYQARFGTFPEHDLPTLARWVEDGLLRRENERLIPTDQGIEHADTLGPLLFSAAVRTRMAEASFR